MAHGREQMCGPGRHTQFILDAQNNIRLVSVREAAGTHSFLARAIESLVLLREATAYRLIGNSVPVATMAAILSQIVNLLRDNPREHLQEAADGTEGTQVEADEAESTLEGISAAQQAAKRLTTICLPAITDVLAAQQHDAVTQSYRAQLLDLGTTDGKAKLRAQGICRREAHLRAI
jgi:hypothetical protein